MGLLDKLRKNPIERMKLQELREEEMRLKNQVERIRKDINRIEKEKKDKFQEGIGADLIKKKMLAQEIKKLDTEAKLKMKNFMALHKQYMLVTNLLVIKKYEQELKRTKLWEKLTKVSPEELETALIRINLQGKEFEEVVDNLNRVFEIDVTEFEATEDEVEKQLLEAWSSVEAGTMDVESVEKMLSVEKSLEGEKEKEG
ncbi:chromosome assembly protein [Archaeoglobales archaeon]|nr:MAG: chromosome assembly protein [Archaeoglobales archaeon]